MEVGTVFGMIIDQQERLEIEYLLKREMDEILFDFQDERIERIVKNAMEERYKILFALFKRVAPANECMRYIPGHLKSKD